MRESILYIWLQLAIGISNGVAGEVLSRFGSVAEVYKCEDFSFLGQKRERYIKALSQKDTSTAFEIFKRCESKGIRILGFYGDEYPLRLRSITAPPVCLYCIGQVKRLNGTPCIAIVGTRNMTEYGKEVAESFAFNFAKSGATVVSGLAKGVDTAAHRGAVMAGGFTVAVLGCPIDEIYPRENAKAFKKLYEVGLVMSELYPGCPRTRADFPNRNRIISGLCDITVIAEAGEHSGALITAKHALSQGRAVYAVPGSIGAENAGTNALIKTGVPVATNPYDVTSSLALEYPTALRPYEPALTERVRSYGNVIPEEDTSGDVLEAVPGDTACDVRDECDASCVILSLLEKGREMSADELTLKTGIGVPEVLTALTILEIEGSVTAVSGGRYRKI